MKGGRQATSGIWEHMERVIEYRSGVEVKVAVCAVEEDGVRCTFKSPGNEGKTIATAMCARHLQKRHGLNVQLRGQLNGSKITEQRRFYLDRLLAVATVKNGWPLSTPTQAGTRYLASRAVPGWVPCSAQTFYDRHMLPMAERVAARLGEAADEGAWFQAFIDGWSTSLHPGSAAAKSCIGVCTTYLTADLHRQKQALCVRELPGSHTAPNIRELTIAVLAEKRVALERVVDMAADNATAEVAVIEGIQMFADVHHTRCYGHTLNLAVKDALEVLFVCCGLPCASKHGLIKLLMHR